MEKSAFAVFEYMTDIPVNFWAVFLIATAPILVFSIAPPKPQWMRFWRLVFAAGLTYVLLNLSLHTGRAIEWRAYQECQSQFSDGVLQQHEECGKINIADGASNIFYLYAGWIPATAYVGIWEFLWRIRSRKKLKELGKNYKGRWFSNITIGFSIFSFVIFPLILLVDWLMANS